MSEIAEQQSWGKLATGHVFPVKPSLNHAAFYGPPPADLIDRPDDELREAVVWVFEPGLGEVNTSGQFLVIEKKVGRIVVAA